MRHIILSCSLLLATALSCFAAVDSGLIALAPATSKLVASIDISSASRSEFGQYLLRQIDSEDQGLRDFTAETGFDPRRDLEALLFTSPSPTGEGKTVVILARGSFDVNRLKAVARAKGATIQEYEGVVLLINRGDGKAIAFPEAGIAAVGNTESVRSVIAHRSNPTSLEPQLLREIESVGPANDVWFVSPSGAQFLPNAGSQLNDKQALQSIVQSTGGIRFGETVTMSLDALTRSPQDADSLAAVIRLLANMLGPQKNNDAVLSVLDAALKTMDLEVKGSDLHISLSVSEKKLEQIAQLHSRQMR